MLTFEFDIKGDKELVAGLKRVAAEVRGPIVQNGLHAGALIVQNDARRRAPYRVGNLRRSIHIEPAGPLAVKIGTDLEYAAIHEFGGTIVPKNRKFLRFEINGKVIFTKKVVMPARPYLRPALDENRDAVRAEIRDAVLAGIARAMA